MKFSLFERDTISVPGDVWRSLIYVFISKTFSFIIHFIVDRHAIDSTWRLVAGLFLLRESEAKIVKKKKHDE